jgi:PKD repeat protein
MAITPDGRYLYIAEMNANEVGVFSINSDGTLTAVACTTACATGALTRGIAIAPNGRYLYATNYTDGDVSPFSINSDGTLSAIACSPSSTCLTGTNPVMAAVDPSSSHLYVVNQGTGSISPFSIGVNGSLTPIACLSTDCNTGYHPLGIVTTPDQAPAASFFVSPGRPGKPSSFNASASTATSGYTIARYTWDFGDGTIVADGGATPTHSYAAPATYTVTLTVTDNAGCSETTTFTGHTVACDGASSATTTREVMIVPDYRLTVSVSGPGHIIGSEISCPTSCTATYGSGTAVALAPAAATGATFAGWSGACSGRGLCHLTMSADRSVTATFEKPPRPPDTRITNATVKSRARTARFTFKATGQASGFQCALLSGRQHNPKFRSCRSPKSFAKLKRGRYKFEVRAIGRWGTDPTPATREFKIG